MVESKSEFVNHICSETKHIALLVLKLSISFKYSREIDIILRQLVRSTCSVGANYRAACRARSIREYYSKLCITVEELDKCEYWLELLNEVSLRPCKDEIMEIHNCIKPLLKILGKSKFTTSQKLK